jgi:hypothetical protein
MSYTKLDDDQIVQMRKDEIPVSIIRDKFNVSSGTIYRHLRANGIKIDKSRQTSWTDQEEVDLITAREEGLTGAEIYKRIPTRTPVAIKLHLQKLRDLKKIR